MKIKNKMIALLSIIILIIAVTPMVVLGAGGDYDSNNQSGTQGGTAADRSWLGVSNK